MNDASPRTVWVVDDDETIRFVLERALRRDGHSVQGFDSVSGCAEALASAAPDLLLTDIRLPDAEGLDLLEHLRTAGCQDVPVIAMTAYSGLDQAVEAFQHGVFDYLPKPFDLDQVLAVVRRALAVPGGAEMPPGGDDEPELIGDSPAMQDLFRTLGRLSRTDVNVLITGETGTGKELVARALHRHSPRSGGPFVAINTAAIPTELLESELFGHERGAFTGAHTRRPGRFEEADGGTLFLDEIGDMPLALQTRLLRVLAEGDYYRVGGRDLLRADVRVITATHQDLEARVREGSFREDLFHRLNVIRMRLPPLRERPEDIQRLARHFLNRAATEMDLEPKRLGAATLAVLRDRPWPGNVRELQNLCRHLVVMAPGEDILPEDLPPTDQPGADTDGDWSDHLRAWAEQALASGRDGLMPEARERLERVLIDAALRASDGQQQAAARRLGIGRNTLARKTRPPRD